MGRLLAVSHRLHALRAALIVLPGSALRSTDWWLPRVLICISGRRLAVPAPPTLLPSSLTAVAVRSRSMIASREATSRRRSWIHTFSSVSSRPVRCLYWFAVRVDQREVFAALIAHSHLRTCWESDSACLRD